MQAFCSYFFEHECEMRHEIARRNRSKRKLVMRIGIAGGVVMLSGAIGYVMHVEWMYKGIEFVAAGLSDRIFDQFWE